MASVESEYRARFGSGQPAVTRPPSQYDRAGGPPSIPKDVLARDADVRRTWRPDAPSAGGAIVPPRMPQTGEKLGLRGQDVTPFYGQASDYSPAGLRSALGIQIDPATGQAGGIHPNFEMYHEVFGDGTYSGKTARGRTRPSRLNPETGQWEEVPYHVAYSTTPGWRPDQSIIPIPQQSQQMQPFDIQQPSVGGGPRTTQGQALGPTSPSMFFPGLQDMAEGRMFDPERRLQEERNRRLEQQRYETRGFGPQSMPPFMGGVGPSMNTAQPGDFNLFGTGAMGRVPQRRQQPAFDLSQPYANVMYQNGIPSIGTRY
jgi:hypothetical protein